MGQKILNFADILCGSTLIDIKHLKSQFRGRRAITTFLGSTVATIILNDKLIIPDGKIYEIIFCRARSAHAAPDDNKLPYMMEKSLSPRVVIVTAAFIIKTRRTAAVPSNRRVLNCACQTRSANTWLLCCRRWAGTVSGPPSRGRRCNRTGCCARTTREGGCSRSRF